MPHIYNQPVWVGVVVKLADGSVRAVQMRHPYKCDMQATADVETNYTPWGRIESLPGPTRLRVEIEGYEGDWEHHANIPDLNEIEPSRKAIER